MRIFDYFFGFGVVIQGFCLGGEFSYKYREFKERIVNKLILEYRLGEFKFMSVFERGEERLRLVVSNDKNSIQ